jgi:hypothetical protein
MRGIYHPRIEPPALTKAELATTGATRGVAYFKPPSEKDSSAA